MAYKALNTSKLDAETFNRSEKNTEQAFADLATGAQLPVSLVSFSASISQYVVKSTDLYVVVNASGGTGKVVLPAPPGPTQAVWIKCAKGRAITVVQSSGKAFGGAATALPLDVSQSVLMVNTGTAWEAFGNG